MSLDIALIGLLIGFLVGLTGVGGGVLLAPILLFLGIKPTIVVGTDLFYGAVTKLVGWQLHRHQGNVRCEWVLRSAMGSVPGVFAGAFVIHRIEAAYGSADQFITHALGVVLILAALATVVREILPRLSRNGWPGGMALHETHPRLIVVLGAVIGFFVGITSVGSGSLFALALFFLSPFPPRQVVGTDVAHGAILTAAGAVAHMLGGDVNFAMAANLLVGSIPGVLLGSQMTAMVPARPLKLGLACLILLGGAKLI